MATSEFERIAEAAAKEQLPNSIHRIVVDTTRITWQARAWAWAIMMVVTWLSFMAAVWLMTFERVNTWTAVFWFVVAVLMLGLAPRTGQ